MTTGGKTVLVAAAVVIIAGIVWLVTSGGPGTVELRTGTGAHRVVLRMEAPRVGLNAVTVRITDPDDRPITGGEVTIEPVMLDMSHALPPVPAVRQPSGDYRADRVDLLMTGKWELTVAIHHAGATEHATFTVFV